jgi:hypothetical protein
MNKKRTGKNKTDVENILSFLAYTILKEHVIFLAVLLFSRKPVPVNLFSYIKIQTSQHLRTFRPISSDNNIKSDTVVVDDNNKIMKSDDKLANEIIKSRYVFNLVFG